MPSLTASRDRSSSSRCGWRRLPAPPRAPAGNRSPVHTVTACFFCLLAIAPATVARAQDSSVLLSISGPQSGSEATQDEFQEIKSLISDSLHFALSPDFLLVSDEGALQTPEADYELDLEFKGPYQDCHWKVFCDWKKHDGSSTKCWTKPATVSYCHSSAVDEIEAISCLADFIDLRASSPQRLPKDLCAAAEREVSPPLKVVYTRCFRVQIEAEDWNKRVRLTTNKIPLLIMRELEADFRGLGYDLVPESCFDSGENPQKVDVEIVGIVEEKLETDKLYVELFVDQRSASGSTDAVLERIQGPTQEVARENYKRLGDEIVKHIRKRFDAGE